MSLEIRIPYQSLSLISLEANLNTLFIQLRALWIEDSIDRTAREGRTSSRCLSIYRMEPQRKLASSGGSPRADVVSFEIGDGEARELARLGCCSPYPMHLCRVH